MEFIPAGSISLTSFILVLCFVIFCFLFAVWRAKKTWFFRIATASVLWLGFLSLLVQVGALEPPIPGLMLFFAASNLVSIITALSPVGGSIATAIPMSLLVAFQSFRFPLELILHDWARKGVIPEAMTWSGMNVDIVSGFVAMLAWPFVSKRRWVAWGANVIGFVLLLNVMRVAVMTSPLPFSWKVNPPLQLAFHLPYALIVPVCVGGALMGHIILTRALILRSRSGNRE